MKRVVAIIVAAGEGRRFGSPKQFAMLRGRPVLDWSIARFESHPEVDGIVLVLPDESRQAYYLGRHKKVVAVVEGGPRRQDSVARGFDAVDSATTEIVLVHDGVRPLVGQDVITRVILAVRRAGAAVPAVPVEDTIKDAPAGKILRTLDRESLFRIQTPQGFSYPLLKRALHLAQEDGFTGTDEAMLVERIGADVAVVEGDPLNIKITTRAELKMAEACLGD